VRRWPRLSAILGAVVFALVIAGCSGDDEGADNAPAPSRTSETSPGDGGATPPSAGQLPPEFMKCMADQGFPIESPDEIHSAPQQVLQACFGSLHGGGGKP
jgi:hypothetical protein